MNAHSKPKPNLACAARQAFLAGTFRPHIPMDINDEHQADTGAMVHVAPHIRTPNKAPFTERAA